MEPIGSVGEIRNVHPAKPSDDLPNLDFLRAVAVLLVLFGHFTYYSGLTDIGPLRIFSMGGVGVRIFFVHTCFVLMLSLERQWKKQGGMELFASFMIRRIFRIYPLSIVIVAIIVAFHLPQAQLVPHHFVGASLHLPMIISNLLLIQSPVHSILGPMWSLPYEMEMYLLLPWLFLILHPNQLVWRVAAIWSISLLACLVYFSYAGRRDGDNFLLYVPCFLPGVIAYQFRRKRCAQFPAFLWPGVVIVSVLLFLYKQTLLSNDWFKSWLLCLALGLGVPFFSQISERWITLPAHLIAKYSYGIYLTHWFCIWLAFERLHSVLPKTARFALFVLLVGGLPVLFYHLLEEPMVLHGKRVAKQFDRMMGVGIADQAKDASTATL